MTIQGHDTILGLFPVLKTKIKCSQKSWRLKHLKHRVHVGVLPKWLAKRNSAWHLGVHVSVERLVVVDVSVDHVAIRLEL